MTVATASFYRMRGSLSTGEYPLLANGQDLSSFLVSSVTVKFAKGLQTRITVPSFTGWETVNVVNLDGGYYWLTSAKESTTYNGSIEYVLDYMGPTSLLRAGDSVTMYLERSPTYLRRYLRSDFSDGPSMLTETSELGKVIKFPNLTDRAFYWVQITGLQKVGTEVLTKRYGCFVSVPKGTDISDTYLSQPLYANDTDTYPTLNLIMNYTEDVTGFTKDDVLDISISKRSPYKYQVGYNSGNNPDMRLSKPNGGAINTNFTCPGVNAVMYDITALVASQDIVPISATYTVSDTDLNRMCGSVAIKDWNGNITDTFNLVQGLTFTIQTYADISGIYTIVKNRYTRTVINEGKLPWNGSSWYTYKAYAMDADRSQMENNIKYAKYNYETSQVSLIGGLAGGSISSGLMGTFATGGNPAGALAGVIGNTASAAVSAYELERAHALQIRQYEDDFRLSQKRAMLQSGNAYNTAYGLIYVALTNQDDDLVIGMITPNADASNRLSEYVERFGYPCEGTNTVTIQNGYYRGTMPATATLNGMWFDQFNATLKNGFKFVSP